MSRRIVFAGGAQTRALARIYRSEVAGYIGDDVIFVGTGAIGTDAARSTLLMADIVAMEIDEDGDAIPAGELPGRAGIVRIPNLYCDFLWPFAGRAHPRNRGTFALPGGPYPAEHGDRFLDQMVADGVDETTAITRYKAMDIAVEGELDSRLADRLAIMARLDASAGFDLAPFIADRFRLETLFRTRQRLTMPLLRRLVDQLFAKFGVQGWRADSLRRVPFPRGAQPIHPGVIAHFGLGWASAEDRYPVNEEGFFTFEEFCRRYMGFVWNEALHRGIQAAKSNSARNNPAAAIGDLEQGLTESPDSPLGKLALAVARHAADPSLGAADPALLIDEDSYDPAAEALSRIGTDAGGEMHESGAQATEIHGSEQSAAETPVVEAPFGDAPAGDARAGDAGGAASGAWAPEPELGAPELDARELGAPAFAGPECAAPGIAAHEPGDATPALAAEPDRSWLAEASAEPEAELLAAAAPRPEKQPASEAHEMPAAVEEHELIGQAAPPPARPIARGEAPNRSMQEAARQGSVAEGFTDFRPVAATQPVPQPAVAAAGNDLIEALPGLLPVFADLAGAADRPFGTMPEIMPPPPLRPILPPELQDEAPRPGLLARMLGRK